MMKRVAAWLLILGFILLIINMFWFQIAPELTLSVYIIVVVVFIYYNKAKNIEENQNIEENESKD